MRSAGQVRSDYGSLARSRAGAEIEFAVPYTERLLAGAVLERAMSLAAGLNARISLVAVHVTPFPLDFGCPASTHAFLVEQLSELAAQCEFPIHAEVIMARSRADGFRHAFSRTATVLVGARKHWWRTAEKKLARALARDGRQVVLMYVD